MRIEFMHPVTQALYIIFMCIKPLIRYIGQKNLSVSSIIDKYNICTYCEPFAGSFYTGLITSNKYKDIKYIYNDIDTEIYNFWKCAKTDIFKLFDIIELIYNNVASIVEHDDIMHAINIYYNKNDNFYKAAVTYIIHNIRRFTTSSDECNKIKEYKLDIDSLIEYIDILQRLEIYNMNYSDIISTYNSENTFFLIDPPYYVRNVNQYYTSDCRFIYHREISDIIKSIKGKFLLTYNICDYIKELYNEFNQVEVHKNNYTNDLVISNFYIDDHDIKKIFNTYNECCWS